QDFIETAIKLKLKLDCLDDLGPIKPARSAAEIRFKPSQLKRPIVHVAPVSSSLFYRPWFRIKSVSNVNQSIESENCLCIDPVYTPPSPNGLSVSEKIKFSTVYRGQWFRVILILNTTVTPTDSFSVRTDPWIPITPDRFQLSVLDNPDQWVREYLWPIIEQENPEALGVSSQSVNSTVVSPNQSEVPA
ncbi:hypothetical protein FBUS_00748, partial [Fasciolopsis buskii]